jgi:hypothetical protein
MFQNLLVPGEAFSLIHDVRTPHFTAIIEAGNPLDFVSG